MSTLQDILQLVQSVQSTHDLKAINQAVNARWRVLQSAVAQKIVQDKHLLPGDFVSFFARGSMVFGTVKSVNQKTCSVEPMSGGPHWRVSPGLLTKLDKLPARSPTVARKPLIDLPPVPSLAEMQNKRSEDVLMKEILNVYLRLSPENLAADGERPRNEVIRLERKLRGDHVRLFAELGRVVSEEEAYEYGTRPESKAV